MNVSDYIMISIGYLVSFTITALIISYFKVSYPGLAFIVGSLAGTQIAAWSHCKCCNKLATYRIKAIIGGQLSLLSIIAGYFSQLLLNWIAFPKVTLSISAIGSFIFPFVIFGQIQKSFIKSKK